MKAKALIHRGVVMSACAVLSLSLLPSAVKAKNDGNRERVVIYIGTPSVWSLGQAHYLLGKIQRDNLALATNMPDRNALDPNADNATRIQTLRTLLDVEAQFNEKIGAQNRIAVDEFKDKLKRREQARAELERKQEELDETDRQLSKMREKLAGKQTEYNQINTERLRSKPNPEDPSKTLPTSPPDENENALEHDIAVLSKRIEEKAAERTRINAEVTDLKTRANSDVSGPSLSEVTLGTGGSLPEISDLIKGRIKNVVDKMKDPRFAASIALDNFIGMQYEIVAKQLTLLRDEVGPDERIVFLELPSSVYTVACKGDEYLAQVQWKVSEYYDDPTLQTLSNSGGAAFLPPEAVQYRLLEQNQNDKDRQNYRAIREEAKKPRAERSISGAHWRDADSSVVRAVDIIPRQSALNVNDVQATTSQKNFLGIMKLLIGLGVRVSYQRQQELYEQYLQQEVFASGFGKGRNTFGWTFGPLPGTKRISPGVRTTYAALVIPRSASVLKLEARGVGFKRTEAPKLDPERADPRRVDPNNPTEFKDSNHVVFTDEFAIIVPNENTERFNVSKILYTPARKGEPVTVLVFGDYFSPQSGILVDGVPLTKSLSLGNTATSAAVKDPEGSAIRGQYELVSSREIALKFSMADGYAGTPNITVITPEKSKALNFLSLIINEHFPKTSLRNLVETEPMFMPAFSLQKELIDLRDDPRNPLYKYARLRGTGLRRRARVWINNVELRQFIPVLTAEHIVRQNIGEYQLRFLKTSSEEYSVRYQQIAIHSLEADEFVYKKPDDPKPKKAVVMNYAPNARTGKAVVDVRLKSDDPICSAEVSPRREGVLLGGISREADKQFRASFLLNYDNLGNSRVEKTRVSIKVTSATDCRRPSPLKEQTHDLDIPVRPQVARVRAIISVEETDRPIITLEGINLQRIVKVKVGDKEADIIGAAEQGILVVKLPKGMSIKKDVTVQIPLTLETADGVKASVVATVGKPRTRKSNEGSEENGDKPAVKTREP